MEKKLIFFTFWGANFLMYKSSHGHEKHPVLGLAKEVVMMDVKVSKDNRIVDHLEKCSLFSDFQYGFRSS